MALAMQILEAGFEIIHGPAQSFLRKCMPACEMPYFNEHVVDEVNIGPQDLAVLTLNAHRMVEFWVYPQGSDLISSNLVALYHEPAIPVFSEEGLSLLRDAGVDVSKALDPVSELMPVMAVEGGDHGSIVQLPDMVDRFEAPVDVSRLPVFGAVQPLGMNPHEKI